MSSMGHRDNFVVSTQLIIQLYMYISNLSIHLVQKYTVKLLIVHLVMHIFGITLIFIFDSRLAELFRAD